MAGPEEPGIDLDMEQLVSNFIIELKRLGFVVNMNIADLEKQLILTIIAVVTKE